MGEMVETEPALGHGPPVWQAAVVRRPGRFVDTGDHVWVRYGPPRIMERYPRPGLLYTFVSNLQAPQGRVAFFRADLELQRVFSWTVPGLTPAPTPKRGAPSITLLAMTDPALGVPSPMSCPLCGARLSTALRVPAHTPGCCERCSTILVRTVEDTWRVAEHRDVEGLRAVSLFPVEAAP